MTMPVSRYHEFDYWFDCWEILPGQLGNKLLIQWCLSLWQAFERKGKGVLDAREMWRVCEGGGGISTFTGGFLWSKNNSLLVGISLTPSHTFLLHKNPFPFPLKCLPHGLSDVIQSVYPFAVFNIHQAICIVWWLELKYKLLDRWTTFDIGEPRLRKWWRGKEI